MTNRVVVGVITVVVGVGLFAGATVIPSLGSGLLDAGGGEVVATHTTMHFDRVGRPTVVGEVVNGAGVPVDDVTVRVTFSRAGEPIANATDRALVDPLADGAKAPFVVRMGDAPAKPDGYEVTVSYREADARPYDGLVVTESELVDEAQDQILLHGTVANEGGQTVKARVVITFYDEDLAVIGARSVRPSPAAVEPGGTATFRARFRTLGNVPSRAREFYRYEVVAYRIDEPASSA